MADRSYTIDRQSWIQATVQTATRTLDFVAGRSTEPADEWTATSEPFSEGGYKIRVSGPVATACLRCCAKPAHWPTHERLAKIVADAHPKGGNRVQRIIHKFRYSDHLLPALDLEIPPPSFISIWTARHSSCWRITIAPNSRIRIVDDAIPEPAR